MKFIYLLVIIVIHVNLVFGQVKHEVKLDALRVLSSNYVGYYEAIPSKRIGIEVALGFDFRKIYISDFDINAFTIDYYEFSATRFNPSLGGKYYFVITDNGSGLFIGPYSELNFLISREEGYVQKWEEIYNSQAPERISSDNGVSNIKYGIHVGSKWVFLDHCIIEPVITYAIDKQIGKGAGGNSVYNTSYFLKLGYRF